MENNYEDEISLKELIENLIQEWKLIVIITGLATMIAIIASFLIIKPSYETSTSFVMNIPASVQTKVGVYEYMTTSSADYLPLVKDPRVLGETISELSIDVTTTSLSNTIDVAYDSKNKDKKTLVLSVKGSNPELITNIANAHIENYINFLNNEFKYKAINKFLKDYEISSDLLERNMLITNKKLSESEKFLLEISPVVTLQNALTSNPEVAAKYAQDRGINVKNLTNDMLYSEIINPNYAAIETLILEYKKNISNSEINLDDLNSKIAELTEEKIAIDLYNKTGDDSKLRSNYLDIFENKIQVISPAFVPEYPVGPKKALNTVIGFVLGLMLGVFIALFKSYWKKN